MRRSLEPLIISFILFASILLILLPKAYAGNILFIATDSCSYEIYRDLMINFSNITGEVVRPADLGSVKIGSYKKIVFLATNISSKELIDEVIRRLNEDRPKSLIVSQYIYEEYGISSSAYVPDNYIFSYCIYSDKDSLRKIAEFIWVTNEYDTLIPVSTGQLIGLGMIIAAISYVLIRYGEDLTNRLRLILIKLIGLLIIPILRIRVSREDILNHPIRKSISEYVSSRVVVRLSDLMRELKLARGSTEWHLYLLIKYNLIQEISLGRKRYIIDPSKPKEVIEKLISEDEDLRCVWRNLVETQSFLRYVVDEKIIYEVSDKCKLDPHDTKRIISVIIHLQTSSI